VLGVFGTGSNGFFIVYPTGDKIIHHGLINVAQLATPYISKRIIP
jgi:hypothetical protein